MIIMLSISHSRFQSTVVESNYDYWSIYWKDQLVLMTKSEEYARSTFQMIKEKVKELNYVI